LDVPLTRLSVRQIFEYRLKDRFETKAGLQIRQSSPNSPGPIGIIGHANVSERFPLKLNSYGTYDSIYPRCFLTIARQMTKEDIVREEIKHICVEADLRVARRAKEEIQADL